jgi:hypothetical protein
MAKDVREPERQVSPFLPPNIRLFESGEQPVGPLRVALPVGSESSLDGDLP